MEDNLQPFHPDPSGALLESPGEIPTPPFSAGSCQAKQNSRSHMNEIHMFLRSVPFGWIRTWWKAEELCWFWRKTVREGAARSPCCSFVGKTLFAQKKFLFSPLIFPFFNFFFLKEKRREKKVPINNSTVLLCLKTPGIFYKLDSKPEFGTCKWEPFLRCFKNVGK